MNHVLERYPRIELHRSAILARCGDVRGRAKERIRVSRAIPSGNKTEIGLAEAGMVEGIGSICTDGELNSFVDYKFLSC